MCFHVNEPGFIVETTTSSMIVVLPRDADTPPRAWFALASPCASVYVPAFPPHGVPAALASAATWQRFATLRDRVETDPATLGEIRAVLGPVETDLWERADAIAATDAASRAHFVTEEWDRVEAALVRLGV